MTTLIQTLYRNFYLQQFTKIFKKQNHLSEKISLRTWVSESKKSQLSTTTKDNRGEGDITLRIQNVEALKKSLRAATASSAAAHDTCV